MQALEEVKLREVALVELQKRLGDGEGRLKQQQALYEAVRADRNMYSKSLIEAQVGAQHVLMSPCAKRPFIFAFIIQAQPANAFGRGLDERAVVYAG